MLIYIWYIYILYNTFNCSRSHIQLSIKYCNYVQEDLNGSYFGSPTVLVTTVSESIQIIISSLVLKGRKLIQTLRWSHRSDSVNIPALSIRYCSYNDYGISRISMRRSLQSLILPTKYERPILYGKKPINGIAFSK